MATIAEEYSSFVYITNDNPRNENEDKIIEDILSGITKQKYQVIKNRKEAIIAAIKKHENSIIVLLGKGRDNYQIIDNKKQYHSDVETIKEHLDENNH